MIPYAVFRIRCENLRAGSISELERYRRSIQSAVVFALSQLGEEPDCTVVLQDFIEVPDTD